VKVEHLKTKAELDGKGKESYNLKQDDQIGQSADFGVEQLKLMKHVEISCTM